VSELISSRAPDRALLGGLFITYNVALAVFALGLYGSVRFTDELKADHERIQARGAKFTMPPAQVTGSTIALLDDTWANLIQLTQLSQEVLRNA
jgi:predicted enzyme related to lactoylglutathione lyase